MLARMGPLPAAPAVIDVGCSSGYLLEDLRRAMPGARLIGVDLVAQGLRKAHQNVPDAELLHADVCELPLEDACFDAVVSANLLEHVPDDQLALAEIAAHHAPGARAVIVVPTGPGNYDYYDRFLGHERRYARGELARKGSGAPGSRSSKTFTSAPALSGVLGRQAAQPATLRTSRRRRARGQGARGHRQHAGLPRRPPGVSHRGAPARPRPEAPFGIRGLTVLERARGRTREHGAPRGNAAESRSSAGSQTLSIVIPAYNEQDNVRRVYERLAAVMDDARPGLGADLQHRPLHRPHRGADPRAPRAGRPARQDAAFLAPVRPADGDDRRPGGVAAATPSS